MTIRKYWKSASAWALIALTFVACNRQDDLRETDNIANKTEQTKDEPLVEYNVDINLDADIDLNLPIEGEETPRAFGIETDANQKVTKLKFPDAGKTVDIYLLFKHKDTPAATASLKTITKYKLTATVQQGANGKKYLKISNNPDEIQNYKSIKLKAHGRHQIFNEDGWYVSAVITTQNDLDSSEDSYDYGLGFGTSYQLATSPTSIEMPFVAPWTPVKFNQSQAYKTISNSNGDKARDVGNGTLHFKPFGSILALKLRSNLAEDIDIAALEVKSNEFKTTYGLSGNNPNDGGFDFRQVTKEDLTSGRLPRYGYVGNGTVPSRNFTFTQISLASGTEASGVYYLWIAPEVTSPTEGNTLIRVNESGAGQGQSKPFKLKTPTKGYDINQSRCYLTYVEVTSDLMITELFISNHSGSGATVVELYNPTLDDIHLKEYALFRTNNIGNTKYLNIHPFKDGSTKVQNSNSEDRVKYAKVMPLDLRRAYKTLGNGSYSDPNNRNPNLNWLDNVVTNNNDKGIRYTNNPTVVRTWDKSDNASEVTFRGLDPNPGGQKITLDRKPSDGDAVIRPGRTVLLFGDAWIRSNIENGPMYPDYSPTSSNPGNIRGMSPMVFRAYMRGYCDWMVAASNASHNHINSAADDNASTLHVPNYGGLGLVKRTQTSKGFEVIDVTQPIFGRSKNDTEGRWDSDYRDLVIRSIGGGEVNAFNTRRSHQRKGSVHFPTKYFKDTEWEVSAFGSGGGTLQGNQEYYGKASFGTRKDLTNSENPGLRSYSASGWANVPDFIPPTRKWNR